MGKIVTLLIVGVIGLAVWQGLNGLMRSNRLSTLIQETLDGSQNNDEKAIREDLLQRAEREQIALRTEDIQISITFVQGTGYPGEGLAQRGVVAQQKRILIKARYEFPLLGMKRSAEVDGGRMYTMSATVVPSREYNIP